jgi:hypothetical protein
MCSVSCPQPWHLNIFSWVLALLQNALLHKLFWARPVFQVFLETVGPHVEVKVPLVSLQGRRGRRVGQDVALNEVVSSGALVQAFPEVVGCALAFELEGFGLQGPVGQRISLNVLKVGQVQECEGNEEVGQQTWTKLETYGAVVVSSRMCRFLRSCASGRC